MKVKTYIYEANGFIKGQVEATTKRKAKRIILDIVNVFCPTRSLETLKIERVEE